jgi:hypothetical protein
MARLSRIGTSCALLFGIATACGARTGLPLPTCNGEPLARVTGPNIYFILDRSNSMVQPANPANPAAGNKLDVVRSDIANLMSAIGSEAEFGAAEFPTGDLMSQQCAVGTEVMPLRQGDGLPASTVGSTANTFLSATSGPPFGGTPTADTFTNLTSELTGFKGHTFAILATDGGPDCNLSPDETCTIETCTVNIDGLFGCTPNGSNCCLLNPQNCLDETRTIAAIGALAHPPQGEGVRTFVIGIPGSNFGPYPQVLDLMAVAGGTARTNAPDLYYAVDTADSTSLVGALADIAARIAATCAIELEEPPTDPSQVNVVLDGHILPQDGANGWTISGSTVTILGANCDQVHAGLHRPIVTGGCPTVKTLADAATP